MLARQGAVGTAYILKNEQATINLITFKVGFWSISNWFFDFSTDPDPWVGGVQNVEYHLNLVKQTHTNLSTLEIIDEADIHWDDIASTTELQVSDQKHFKSEESVIIQHVCDVRYGEHIFRTMPKSEIRNPRTQEQHIIFCIMRPTGTTGWCWCLRVLYFVR